MRKETVSEQLVFLPRPVDGSRSRNWTPKETCINVMSVHIVNLIVDKPNVSLLFLDVIYKIYSRHLQLL